MSDCGLFRTGGFRQMIWVRVGVWWPSHHVIPSFPTSFKQQVCDDTAPFIGLMVAGWVAALLAVIGLAVCAMRSSSSKAATAAKSTPMVAVTVCLFGRFDLRH